MGNVIVTIAREHGSGGRLIGRKLAEELGFAFYDDEIIAMTAKESGFTEEFISRMENTKTSSFLFSIYSATRELPLTEQVFLMQSNIIKDLAKKGNCVIVGRCADHVLRDEPGCIRTFIHAPIGERVRRVKEFYGEEEGTEEQIKSRILKKDKKRASYYDYFAQCKWGQAQNYNITLDSSMGIDTAVEVLKAVVDVRTRNKE